MVLGMSLVAFVLTISHLRSSRRFFLFFIFPAFLVFIGICINVGRLLVVDLSNLAYLGFLLPWCVFLVIPTLCRIDPFIDGRMWLIFYRFMVFFAFICSLEYWYVISGNQGYLTEKLTSGGWFQTGWSSLFFRLEYEVDGQLAYGPIESRMYGVFLEPGTLGMFLIPVIVWSFITRRYFGFAVLLTAFVLAGSIGAFASLALVPLLYSFIRKKSFFFVSGIMILGAVAVGVLKYDAIVETLESKGESKATRIDNLRNGINEVPVLLTEDPFGMDLSADLEYDPSVKEDSAAQKFATVPLFYQYVIGGILALIGFAIIVFTSVLSVLFTNRDRQFNSEEYTVLISIIPMFAFVFQRASLWDSALFAILFLPSLYRLYSSPSKTNGNPKHLAQV